MRKKIIFKSVAYIYKYLQCFGTQCVYFICIILHLFYAVHQLLIIRITFPGMVKDVKSR